MKRLVSMMAFLVAVAILIDPHAMLVPIRFATSLLEMPQVSDDLLLLVADKTSAHDPHVLAWQDAAREEGLQLTLMTASEFMRPRILGKRHGAAVILPDRLHRRASDPFVDLLSAEVARGMPVMVVFDAASLDLNGSYAPTRSRLSRMVGADYAMYDRLRQETIRPVTVQGSTAVMDLLGLPPGRHHGAMISGQAQTAAEITALETSTTEHRLASASRNVLSSYAHFVTGTEYRASPLLVGTDGGLIAGYHRYGKGCVLFVNLPLGYLKVRSDGMFLHAFLRYFVRHIVTLPAALASELQSAASGSNQDAPNIPEQPPEMPGSERRHPSSWRMQSRRARHPRQRPAPKPVRFESRSIRHEESV